jgi:hypothetical protein
MGIVEKISLDEATLRAIEARAKEAGKSLDDEAAELIRLGLQIAESRESLIARAKALRESLPPQTTDSLTLLREGRDR